MNCVNCGRKGHAASECSQPRKDKGERPCFTCGKIGHEARACPDKPAARAPLKAITMGPAEQGGPKKQYVFCVTALERKAPLGDFIRDKGHVNHNRFQPLTLDSAEFWSSITPTSSISTSATSSLPPTLSCFCISTSTPTSPPTSSTSSLERIGATPLRSHSLTKLDHSFARGGDVSVVRASSSTSKMTTSVSSLSAVVVPEVDWRVMQNVAILQKDPLYLQRPEVDDVSDDASSWPILPTSSGSQTLRPLPANLTPHCHDAFTCEATSQASVHIIDPDTPTPIHDFHF